MGEASEDTGAFLHHKGWWNLLQGLKKNKSLMILGIALFPQAFILFTTQTTYLVFHPQTENESREIMLEMPSRELVQYQRLNDTFHAIVLISSAAPVPARKPSSPFITNVFFNNS